MGYFHSLINPFFGFLLYLISPVLADLQSPSSQGIQSIYTKSGLVIKSDDLCTDKPYIAEEILLIGNELGVKVFSGNPKMVGKDATYEAFSGKLGIITISPRRMSRAVYCQLVSHEFIHVLQHLNGDLHAVEPLGWKIDSEMLSIYGSKQEAEAYSYQNKAGMVLFLLINTIDQDKNRLIGD